MQRTLVIAAGIALALLSVLGGVITVNRSCRPHGHPGQPLIRLINAR
jgi:hypothetical protein